MSSNPHGSHPFAAPEWVLDLTEDDLESIFGPSALNKARFYQRRGVVHNVAASPDGATLNAIVFGTHPYRTTVRWLAHQSSPFEAIATSCTCPVQEDCKHAAALILQARTGTPAQTASALPAFRHTSAPAAPTPPPLPTWESLLAPVIAQAKPSSPDPRLVPVALHISASQGNPRFGSGVPRLVMRPMIRGKSGAWIKTGIAWSDLHYAYSARPMDPAQRNALAAILALHRTNSSQWHQVGDTITSETLGSDLWRLLREAAEADIALVTGHQGSSDVHLLPEPVELVLDLTRDGDGAIVLHPSVDMPGVTEVPVLLGNPGHGLLASGGRDLWLAALTQPLTPALTGLLGTPGGLRIPQQDSARFLTGYYPALAQQATLTSSDGSVEFPQIQAPTLAVEVRFERGHVTRLHWTFVYAVGQDSHHLPLLRAPAGGAEPVVRDAAAEERLLSSLDLLDAAPGLRRPIEGKTRLGVILDPVLSGWATVAFVSDVLPALQEREDIDVTVIGEPLAYEEIEEAPVVAVSTRDLDEDDRQGLVGGTPASDQGAQDWFDLGITVTVGGHAVPLPDLLAALAHSVERFMLTDGTWFVLDVPELHALRRLVAEARALQDDPGSGLRINRFQAGLWEELVALGVVAEQSERWQRTVGDLLALEELPHPDVPTGLNATLRSYQLDGFQWLSFLWEHELGGILADDMGLGKTIQVLTAAQRAHDQGLLSPERPMLVVAPTSVVGTWQAEAQRFTPGLRVAALTQTVARSRQPLAETIAGAHVVVTSYALLRIDQASLVEQAWSAVVLDEAQAVKNHQSRTYQAARSLRAPVKFAVTGTPLENSLMDLWSLLSIVAPGLFSSPKRFGEVYRKPIESGQSPELLATLRRRVRPLMLRRTKEAVAPDLPPKIEQVLTVPLNPAHRRIYDTHLQRERQRILGLLGDVDKNRIAILSALTKLRQLSLDVHLVVPDAPESVRPSKVDVLIEQLVEVAAEGHRCLVFSQFTRFLKVVRERLDAEGIGYVYLDGRTRDRPRRVAAFTQGEDPVFLISLKAGGSGLTLTEADYVFVLDPWWNPAVEAQAVDRTHRIGQDRTVMVYRLVAQDTIEEKVVALQERKRDLFAKVVDDDGMMGAPMSADDIRSLLG